MRMISKIIPVVFLAGCATTSVTPERQLLVACDGVATTISILADYKSAGKLDQSAIDTVNGLRPIINGACHQDALGNSDPQDASGIKIDARSALLLVRGAVAELANVEPVK